ncbi:MAG: 50S ribosomal protein L25 [Candidatus Kaiserbacteria bacterium]|nr:MAG: 50S ribosomal protein L25 [Candidatus Kaiserbacteria bacterium]
MLTLEVKARDAAESPEELRKRGFVPAIFYGPKEESTPIAVEALRLQHVWKEAGETTIVVLKGVGSEKDTLIHDAQFHPVTGKLLHADFYVIEKGKKVKIKVPLEFVGQAPAEKMGHIVVKTLHEVEIEVTPQELPHTLEVDLSSLANVGDHIAASQIKLPGSASLITHGEEIVASVKEFKEVPIEVAPAPETVIIGEEEKKEAEGGEAPAEEKKE